MSTVVRGNPLFSNSMTQFTNSISFSYSHNFSRNLGEIVLTLSPSNTIECGNLDLFEEFLKSMILFIVDHVFEELLETFLI